MHICNWELVNALLPRRKEVQIILYLDRALSHSGHLRLDGGHSATPGRASDIHPLSGCEKDTPTQWGSVMDYDSSAGRYSGGSNVRC